MKAAFALAAAGVAVAQGTYPGSCPAPGETGADGRYSCNPAHSYPEGQICQEDGGCYYLRVEGPGVYATPSATVSVDVPEYRTSSAPVYSVDVPEYRTETPSVTVDVPEYRTETPKVSVDVPEYRTSTVSAITTYCPSSTILTHEQKTYTVTSATTLTLPCPGGCVVTTPIATPKAPETHPATQPATTPATQPKAPTASVDVPEYRTPSVSVDVPAYRTPSMSVHTNTTQQPSATKSQPAVYTGAAVAQSASGVLAAVLCVAAYFF